ncbi:MULTISPECIES: dockerin type I domain-containing protein [unclassified Paenibacillus]|uniref:dockerin type I domain-containing protein n=1 Tax=unclassified Paenibacillus TaxID=185978 RepID=UPI00363C3B30
MNGFINKRAMAMLLTIIMALQSWQLAVPPAAKAAGALPSGWTATTMNGTSTGNTIVKQEASSYSNGQFDIEAVDGKQQSVSGTANGDTVYFLYMPVEGDFTITARLVSVAGPPDNSVINSNSRAALMVKNGVSNTSASFTASYFPTISTPNTGSLGYYRRFAANNSSSSSVSSVSTPVYMKLQKLGTTFTASYSADGVTYNSPYTTQTDTNTMTTATLNVGLAITHATVKFDKVKIVNASGTIFDSASSTTNPDPETAPAAPTGLQATAGDNQVSLSWSAVQNASSYTVKRSTGHGGPYSTLVSNVTGTSHVDTTTSNGTTYYYAVSAVNANGESENSSEKSAMPHAAVVPVSSITVSSSGGSTISTLGGTLQMQANVLPSNATNTSVSWHVYEFDGTTATDKATILGSGLLQASKNGTVRVVARAKDDSNVQGSTTVTITGQTIATPPSAPTGVTAVPGVGQVTLSWNTVTDATYYSVKRAMSSGGSYTTIASSVYAATYLDTNVTNGLTYYYVITSRNAYGESGNSTPISAEPSGTPNSTPVSSITVTGGTAISADGGTLQLQATVLPNNATNASVDWFVFEADGVTATDKAMFNGSGLLQAVKNGTVKVVARAKDGSNVQGSASITISGQTLPDTTIPEDVDGNQKVDIGDLGIVAHLFGLTSSSPNWEAHKAADVNKDNVINELDLQLVANKIE